MTQPTGNPHADTDCPETNFFVQDKSLWLGPSTTVYRIGGEWNYVVDYPVERRRYVCNSCLAVFTEDFTYLGQYPSAYLPFEERAAGFAALGYDVPENAP